MNYAPLFFKKKRKRKINNSLRIEFIYHIATTSILFLYTLQINIFIVIVFNQL